MVDKQALYETLDAVIAADAEGKWNQDRWVYRTHCGTGGCFCGWRALLDGGVPMERDASGIAGMQLPDGTQIVNYDGPSMTTRSVVTWHAWGEQRFGLGYLQTLDLFRSSNTLDDLKQMVDDLCA